MAGMVAPRRKLDLRKTLFLLPNMITLSSIFCGFDSMRLSARGANEEDFYRASILLVFAMLFEVKSDPRVALVEAALPAYNCGKKGGRPIRGVSMLASLVEAALCPPHATRPEPAEAAAATADGRSLDARPAAGELPDLLIPVLDARRNEFYIGGKLYGRAGR